ncbi:ABC transporter permease [Vallitalea okinawensis]|uniref:ABC transporter permease n=1 Tax=Vallitalea okinawensis TaxID=2078660 RepID=UPI000CFB9CF3|nr:FtsX-like permease family protein [Vallitalea okinawensis]
MIIKILKKDIVRNKVITAAVFIFITLSALLMASGSNMLIDLGNSLDYLFEASNAPHFVQYHTGEFDQVAINDWSFSNISIKQQQTSEMINIEGSKIYLNNNEESEADTVMEMGFVKQNESFDYLLNLNNEKIEVENGEIAVPIFYMQKNGLEIGDPIFIKDKKQTLAFTITDFVRDVQMNPSMVSSKRFVVSNDDFIDIKEEFGEIEYIIGFQLYDLNEIPSFRNAYSSSGLPQKGMAVDYELFVALNSLTDGLVAAVIIFISFLLSLIALLCLRFTILATIEEDFKEIGVMKAIGILPKAIKRIYLSKYVFLASTATFVGFIVSIFLNQLFSRNIRLYFGVAPKGNIEKMLPLVVVCSIFIIVVAFCGIILKRFNKISAIEAMRMGNTGETYRSTKALALYKRRLINPNVFIGIRDVFLRLRLYALLFFVFVVCTFIMIIPLNFYNTIQSPDLVKYMGMGRSDIYLRLSNQNVQLFNQIVDYIKEDQDIVKYAPSVTSKYEIINNEGYEESISIETGDFTVFPIDYISGVAPILDNEIALSYLNAKELHKEVGDFVEVLVGENHRTMIISGIYQDITNGGKTAKANMEPNHEAALWYIVNMEVTSNVSEKIDEYEDIYPEAKITDLEGYFHETFGNIINQLKFLTMLGVVIAIVVSILITSLFLKMLIAKDLSQIAIMRSIGLRLKDIKIQYITRALVILNSGIIVGTIISNTVGKGILGIVLSTRGASNIELVVNPLEAYIISPVVLMIIVTFTTLVSIVAIKEFNISDINAE